MSTSEKQNKKLLPDAQYLLRGRVGGDVQDVANKHQQPLQHQLVLLMAMFPVLKRKTWEYLKVRN